MKISGEWELTPNDLAYIFSKMAWMYATPTLGYGIPDAAQIEKLFTELRKEAEYLGEVLGDETALVNRGRFLAVKEPGIGCVDLYLNVGYMDAESGTEYYVDEEDINE